MSRDVERLAALARAGRRDELVAALGDGSPDCVDHKGDSLVMLAAYHGHADLTALLLDLGADPDLRNARGLSPLDGAAWKGDARIVTMLLDAGADADGNGGARSPLMWAAAFGRRDVVHLLLRRGADPSRRDAGGLTALDHARVMGAEEVAALLAA